MAVTPVPTKLRSTAFAVRAEPSSCTPRTATKQFASVGPHGSTNSAPGSMVAPMVKGLVRAAAKPLVTMARLRNEILMTDKRNDNFILKFKYIKNFFIIHFIIS